MPSKKTVHVAVGVIRRPSNNGKFEILISKRHDDAHQGGLWEFPGGKVESHEVLSIALARELDEELGLRLDPADEEALRPLIQIYHDYGDKAVLLDVCLVTKFTHAPNDGVGREGQLVKWVDLDRLNEFSFPKANVPIISACQLSDHYLITPVYDSFECAKDGLEVLHDSTTGLILLRQPQLGCEEYFAYLDELLESIPGIGSRLMLSLNISDFDHCTQIDVSQHLMRFEEYSDRVKGVHFPSKLAAMIKGRDGFSNMLVAMSCHSLDELKLAEELRADFVTLSPVQKTPSHPDAKPLGWPQFKEWVKLSTIPVYALGGMQESDLRLSFQAGAQGIAGISTWMK